MPFWFGELHLSLTFLSALFVVGGGVDHWRTEVDRSVVSSLSRLRDR
jgi:hypothetical protein